MWIFHMWMCIAAGMRPTKWENISYLFVGFPQVAFDCIVRYHKKHWTRIHICRWATHLQMWHSSQSIQCTSYFMVESWLNHLINWRLLTALQNDAQRRTVQLSLTGCWDLAESGWKWCENLCVDGGAKKSMKSITEYSVYLCISRWESSSQVYSSGSVMCESFLSSQMAANQVFQGAGCFARLVFFGIMLQERVVKAPLVVTNHMRFGSQFPNVAGHFVRLAGLCQSQKSRQKTRVPLMQKLFSDVLIWKSI